MRRKLYEGMKAEKNVRGGGVNAFPWWKIIIEPFEK